MLVVVVLAGGAAGAIVLVPRLGDETPDAGQAASGSPTREPGADQPPASPSAPTGSGKKLPKQLRAMATEVCDLPRAELVRTVRGDMEGRSGQVQFLPYEPDFAGDGLPHVGPWDYLQSVPMLWYGPGHIKAQGSVQRPVTMADIAPTQAKLLDFTMPTADGKPMSEALVEGAGKPPKLIVTIVWDAAGRNVLDEWRSTWPYLRQLARKGTWYENATVGSTPSTTAPVHATLGTGTWPKHHGIVAHRSHLASAVTAPWETGPTLFVEPTLADLYDRANGNAPVVGAVATREIHLGMIGHGSAWGGGDKDLVVLRADETADTLGEEGDEWNLSAVVENIFTFPAYAATIGGFAKDVRTVDQADGATDQAWRGNDMDELLNGFETPARVPYQTRLLERMIVKEGFGADEIPDLLFTNYKLVDFVSHAFSMNSLEMRDSVEAQDTDLKEFVSFLDETVGKGEWVLALTADHGAIPDPATTGALPLSTDKMLLAIEAAFDPDPATRVVTQMQSTSIMLNEDLLKRNGYMVLDVVALVREMTKGEIYLSEPPPFDETSDPAFEVVFPSALLERLPCLSQRQGPGGADGTADPGSGTPPS